MSAYDTARLANKAKVLMGQSPPSAACSETGPGLPFIQGNAEFGARYPAPILHCSAPTRIAQPDDLLLSVRAPVGALNQAPYTLVLGRGLSAIRFDALNVRYGWHALSFAAPALDRVAQGTTFVAVSREDVENLQIPWHAEANPRIAAILDTADQAFAATQATIEKLRQVRQGLLHDLLTRGLDANGNLRDPVAQREQFQNSSLGPVPTCWTAAPLGHFLTSVEYGISTSLGDAGRLPVLRMNNLAGGEADLTDLKFALHEVPDHLLLRDGDVLFNRTNSYEHVGRTGIWRGQCPIATFASYLVRLNPVRELLKSEFLNLVLNMPATQQRMRRFATPAVQQVNINPTQLRFMTVAVPTRLEEQERIILMAKEYASPLIVLASDLAKLRGLRDGLMSDLLTGRVVVPENVGGTP